MNGYDILASLVYFACIGLYAFNDVRQRRRIRNLERALKDSIAAWEESCTSCEHKGYWVLRGERIEAWIHALNRK